MDVSCFATKLFIHGPISRKRINFNPGLRLSPRLVQDSKLIKVVCYVLLGLYILVYLQCCDYRGRNQMKYSMLR